jgi:hypothetical protein
LNIGKALAKNNNSKRQKVLHKALKLFIYLFGVFKSSIKRFLSSMHTDIFLSNQPGNPNLEISLPINKF